MNITFNVYHKGTICTKTKNVAIMVVLHPLYVGQALQNQPVTYRLRQGEILVPIYETFNSIVFLASSGMFVDITKDIILHGAFCEPHFSYYI